MLQMGEVENLWTAISCVQVKRFEFWKVPFGRNFSYLPTLKISKSPHLGNPDFCRTKVFSDVFNHSNFKYSALIGLKVDSMGRKRNKKVRKKKNKKRKRVFKFG